MPGLPNIHEQEHKPLLSRHINCMVILSVSVNCHPLAFMCISLLVCFDCVA